MAYKSLTDSYIDIVEGKTDEASVDLLRKKLRKIKGITKDQIQVIATMPTPVLTTMINQLSMIVSQKEDVNEEVISEKIQYKGYPTKYAALHGQLGLKTLAQARAVDHLIVAGGKKPDQIAKIFKNFGPSQFQDIVDLLNVSTKPKDLKDTEKKLRAGFHHESVKENITFAGHNSYVGQEQGELEESPLVADDIAILDGILDKIRDDIIKDKIKGRLEKSWPKMQQLAKLAGYNISKKMQAKGKTYRWDLKK